MCIPNIFLCRLHKYCFLSANNISMKQPMQQIWFWKWLNCHEFVSPLFKSTIALPYHAMRRHFVTHVTQFSGSFPLKGCFQKVIHAPVSPHTRACHASFPKICVRLRGSYYPRFSHPTMGNLPLKSSVINRIYIR